jgi:transketolase
MRTAFIETLCRVAAHDERVWLLTGDVGYSVLERFAEKFPERFVNVGVAEQNMIGTAAGLALSGKRVFTYTIANFATFRCLEQIRNDVCYHNLDVTVVSVGGGVAYGAAGYTHHAIEDLAIMQTLPNMSVIAPGDPVETRLAVEAIVKQSGPTYLRLGKASEPMVHPAIPPFSIGQAVVLREGKDVTLISTGGILSVVVNAADLLLKENIQARIISMHTLKPIDVDAILRAAAETRALVCIEEHRAPGALFGAVATVLCQHRAYCPVIDVNLGETIMPMAYSQEGYRTLAGLTAENISKRTLRFLDES